jgi:hypothetical protein
MSEPTQPPRSQPYFLIPLALLLVPILAWTFRYWAPIYLIIFAIVIMGGYPVLGLFKRNQLRPYWAALIFAVVAGGVLGLYFNELAALTGFA